VTEWKWISEEAALAAHREQLAEHGGGDGIRDLNLFQSAMARPQNLAAYGEPDAAQLAAGYAFGLAKNHPLVDGNKRTAAVVSEGFLGKNGYQLTARNAEVATIFEALAAGELSEEELAGWFRERIAPADGGSDRG
jgi:death-on-curing protein